VLVLNYGSGFLKTYLPNSDIDFTIIKRDFMEGKQENSQIIAQQLKQIYSEFQRIRDSLQGKGLISELQHVENAEVEIVKLQYSGFNVDISAK